MQCVKAGGDRQVLHEAIREHSMAAGCRVKEEGAANDLIERIAADPLFEAIRLELPKLIDPMRFVGRAPDQVTEFIEEVVEPILLEHSEAVMNAKVDAITV